MWSTGAGDVCGFASFFGEFAWPKAGGNASARAAAMARTVNDRVKRELVFMACEGGSESISSAPLPTRLSPLESRKHFIGLSRQTSRSPSLYQTTRQPECHEQNCVASALCADPSSRRLDATKKSGRVVRGCSLLRAIHLGTLIL